MSMFKGRKSPVSAPVLATLALALGALVVSTSGDASAASVSKEWKKVAKDLRNAVRSEAKADYLVARARASTLDSDERDEALDEAKEEFKEAKALANEQFGARLDLAALLEEDGIYRHDVDPADFVAVIDNPLMPLFPGTTRTYVAETEEGTETIVVTVLAEKKEILGVMCTVVRDTVRLDGVLVEDTLDWFAQDVDGNVWYFGEIALNYEDGDITDVDGSWRSGVDGAQPGIVMPAAPVVGRAYRQEFLAGEAEDWAQVLALDASATVPFGSFAGCLQTLDATPMEPDAVEHKYYAPGIGVVLEVDPETNERVELVSVTTDN